MILNPNDGFGCGRSIVWEIKAVKIAKKNGEACKCIDYLTILIKMIPDEVLGKHLCKCQVKCPDCNSEYNKTAKKLTQKFLEFYGK